MSRHEFDPNHAQEFVDLFGCEKPPRCAENPRPQTPNTDPALAIPVAGERTQVEESGELVDELRQMEVDAGLRPYRVFSVVYEWTGREVGRGRLIVLRETEFLPRPIVTVSRSRLEAHPAGTKLSGIAWLEEVSPRYTEDDLNAMFPTHLEPFQKSFIEVAMDSRDGPNPIRRRYTIKGTPQRRADMFDWRVPLTAQEGPRDRFSGQLDYPKFYPTAQTPDGATT